MALLVVCLLFWAHLVEAVSNGVALTCDVDNNNLGTTDRVKNTNRTMWWVLSPQFAGTQYTTATVDPPTGTGPTSYVPGQWMDIFVRTTNQDEQWTGIIMYAVNSANVKVGQWQPALGSPFFARDGGNCVVHSNADPKNYLNVFKFQGPPVGTGPITIKALVKFGLAFPSLTSNFWWPNNAHLALTEGAQVTQTWFQGEVGESCITVCGRQNLGCDLPTMQKFGNSSTILSTVKVFSNCTGPMFPGCSSHSPSVGSLGCFYHDDKCLNPPDPTTPYVRADPCAGLYPWNSSTIYNTGNNPVCCTYAGNKWCAAQAYLGNNNPGNNPCYLYGAWAPNAQAPCQPAGGWAAGQGQVVIPTRTNQGVHAITCEATSQRQEDGMRICACSANGQRTASAANHVVLPLAIFVLPLALLL